MFLVVLKMLKYLGFTWILVGIFLYIIFLSAINSYLFLMVLKRMVKYSGFSWLLCEFLKEKQTLFIYLLLLNLKNNKLYNHTIKEHRFIKRFCLILKFCIIIYQLIDPSARVILTCIPHLISAATISMDHGGFWL